jgi:hypothetical protein
MTTRCPSLTKCEFDTHGHTFQKCKVVIDANTRYPDEANKTRYQDYIESHCPKGRLQGDVTKRCWEIGGKV